ncbi:MAG: DMT family transporter [Clostridia bacterium]|nr:DMT family transporter [Clostridia bacterium]
MNINEKRPFLADKRGCLLLALIYTFLWGSAFPLVKICMDAFGTADGANASKCLVAGLRFTISGGALLLICLFRRKKDTPAEEPVSLKKSLPAVLLYGLLATALQYGLTYIGLSYVDGSRAAVYDQLAVFFVILSSGLFFRDDKLTLPKILGCIIGFAGAVMVSITGWSLSFSWGEGLLVLGAVVQAAACLLAKRVSGVTSPFVLIGGGQFTGGAVLILGSLALGGNLPQFNATAFGSLAALAFISAAAYVLSVMPLKYHPASEISVYNLLIPVFGGIMSAVILKEQIFSATYLLAVALIVAGIALVNVQIRNRK